MNTKKFDTLGIIKGEKPNLSGKTSSDIVSPIHVASTFAKKSFEEGVTEHEYSRLSNPTRSVLEQKITALEGGKYAICYSSGMAAETSLFMSLLESGDEVICFSHIYGGTRRLLEKVLPKFGITTHFVDMTDISNIEKYINKKTKIIFTETPTNPLLVLCDLEAIAKLGKQKNVYTVVDNTFASPFIQKPLELGFDIVTHSMTKYINGHSDSIAGSVVVKDEEIYEKLRFVSNSTGMSLSPFDSYLNARGIKTLSVRMKVHCKNALEIAGFLENHPKIEKVVYPGLSSHPQHKLAKKQMDGYYGGVIAAYIKGGAKETRKFVDKLDIFILAESLGGVESLIGCPFFMSHGSMEPEDKAKLNITENLLRISIGIEDVEDLKNDISQALDSL